MHPSHARYPPPSGRGTSHAGPDWRDASGGERRPWFRAPATTLCVLAAGCAGPQSTLSPAGRGAEIVAELTWWMAAGALGIWLAVVALAWYVIRVRPEEYDERAARRLIIWGGAIVPSVVLLLLLAYGLHRMPELLAPPGDDALTVAVSGEEWWWRIRYEPPDGEPVDSANELRLPLGRAVRFRVTSPDVIHSFWIPSLGGKVDMIPGRTNELTLEATRTGTFRGVCAEFCGHGHALMAFRVVVMEPAEFEAWLDDERGPATAPSDSIETRGAEVFQSTGCGACHGVRGTEAIGRVGPDLTHLASRATLAAGTLENTPQAMRRWLAEPAAIKPGVHMPPFGELPEADFDALVAYLGSLQ